MDEPQPPDTRALTWRSASIALLLVAFWVLGACFMAVQNALHTHQLLMVLGFGAILTIFLLQFPTVFLVSVVVLWGGTFVMMVLGAGPADKARVLGGIVNSLVVAIPMLALAVWVKLRPLRRPELVIVYACVLIAIPWCVCIKAVLESSTANLFELQRNNEPQLYAWAKELPWWGPTLPATAPSGDDAAAAPTAEMDSRAAIDGFTRGNGGRVPWKLWRRPILYWTSMCLAYEAMIMGILLLFRRRLIEYERLPFVWSQPALEILRMPEQKAGHRRRWLMFAIGLGICLPAVLAVGPTGQPLINWQMPPWVGSEGIRGGFDLTELNLLAKTQLKLWWGPLVLTILLLFPVDVLMTTALTFILMNLLLPGIMRSAGLQVGPQRLAEFTKWGLRFGGCAGLLLWTTVFAIVDWVRAPKNNVPKADRAGDIPTVVPVCLAVGGLVAFVLLGCYATTIIQMLFLTGFVIIYTFAQTRQRAEGMPLTYDNNIASHQMVTIQRDYLGDHYNLAVNDPNKAVTGSSWAAHWMQWGFAGQLKSFGPHNMLLEAFKVAHELKVHARTVAKAILLTMLIVAAVTPMLYIKLMYIYGFENSFQGNLTTRDSFTQWSNRSARYGLDSTSNFYRIPTSKTGLAGWYETYRNVINGVVGILIIGGLFYLRREYPRFPLSPVGVVLGAEVFASRLMPFSPENIWFTFLIAWIAKSLIFRWLGVRSFREKVQPALVMILCGMIFAIMMYVCRYVALGLGSLK